MIKFVVAALWLCAVTAGALVYSFQSGASGAAAEAEAPASPMLGGLDYLKTEVISVPVLRQSAIQGYFLARLVYTVDPATMSRLSVPADAMIVDQVYSHLFANPQLDFSQTESLDLDAFRAGIRDSINARVGEPLVHEVLVEQIDFLSKDEIRDNALRRKVGSDDKPKGNKVFHH